MCLGKNVVYIGRVWYFPQFQASTGGLGTYPSWMRGDCCVMVFIKLFMGVWVVFLICVNLGMEFLGHRYAYDQL